MPRVLLLRFGKRQAIADAEPMAATDTSSLSTSSNASSLSSSTSVSSLKSSTSASSQTSSTDIVPTTKRAGRSCSDAAPVVMTIADVVVPGLGVSIAAVLVLIQELCKRLLKRKHERIRQVSKRLADLYEHATAMETQGKFAPSDWLERFRDVVARFQAFMVACEERSVLARVVSGAKEYRDVQALEEEVYSLYRCMDFQPRSGCCIM